VVLMVRLTLGMRPAWMAVRPALVVQVAWMTQLVRLALVVRVAQLAPVAVLARPAPAG
jgi:hypothetical protein